MAIVLDVIVVLIIVLTVWNCCSKGFIRSVFDMLKFTVSVICAIIFKNGLAKIIMKSGFYDSTKMKLQAQLSEAISNAGAKMSDPEMLEAFSNENPKLAGIVEYMGADLEKTRIGIENAFYSGSENIAEIAAESILTPAMESIAHILAFTVIFIVAYLLICIAEYILDKIFGLPLLSGINRFGGVLAGIICAVLYASLFVTISKPILSNPGVVGGSWERTITEKTYVYSYVDNHNIISFFMD